MNSMEHVQMFDLLQGDTQSAQRYQQSAMQYVEGLISPDPISIHADRASL
jgi:hypothetical protein